MPTKPPSSARLTPGNAFHLQPSGSWKVEHIPSSVLESALPSAFLTIQGIRSTIFETPEGEQWAQKSLGVASTRKASEQEYSPRPGDKVTVKPVDGDRFHVKGTLDGTPIAGVAETTRGGGLGYTPDEGSEELTDNQYDTLVDIMDDADPSWGDTADDFENEEDMDPNKIASALRNIADRIDASKQPSRSAVATSLKQVLSSIEKEALPQSNAGKGMLKKLLEDANKALDSGDDSAFKAVLEKLSKSA